MLKKGIIIGLSISVSILFTGCGSDDESSSSSSVTFKGITYTDVKSSKTGKTWLNKNLGASQVCTSKTDSACYGDYYQWGRETDGHEKSNSTVVNSQVAVITNAGSNFLTGSYDWSTTDSSGDIRQSNWAKTDGSVICPSGYRVPTFNEIQDEFSSDTPYDDKNFESNLKFSLAGHREFVNGGLINQGSEAAYWTQNNHDTNTSSALLVQYTSTYSTSVSNGIYNVKYAQMAFGLPVRCIKD